MKAFLLLFFVAITAFGTAQKYESIEITNLTIDDFFKTNSRDDVSTLYVLNNPNGLEITDGTPFGADLSNGTRLVLFIPKNLSPSHHFKVSKPNEEDLELDNTPVSFNSANSTLNCYKDDQLIFTYNL